MDSPIEAHSTNVVNEGMNLEETQKRKPIWRQLFGDTAAAITSATCVTPAVVIIDRVVVEKSSLGRSLVPGLQTYAFCAVTQPRRFFLGRPFGYVWTLYAATYAVANCSETLATKLHEAAVGIVAVASVFLVNVPLGIWKDIRFSQIYGAGIRSQQGQPKAVTPTNSRKGVAAFLFRDGVTIGTSFALAPALASAVPDTVTSNPHTKAMITQLTVPMIGQMFSTPVHLLGLDLFTRSDSAKLPQRLSRVKKDILAATTIRCMRILPTFGFGCILNRDLRKLFSGNEND